MSDDRPIAECYWVADRFLAGEYPGDRSTERTEQRVEALQQAGITLFVDLTPEGDLPPYAPLPAEGVARHVRLPIKDFKIPTFTEMDRIQETIAAERERDGAVYLHCHGGIGRTGTVVACWHVRHGMTAEEALEYLLQQWRTVPKSAHYHHSPETAEQVAFVKEYAAYRKAIS